MKNVDHNDSRLRELSHRSSITAKSRYRASERLETHHKFSQWAFSLISVALIFIPLIQTFKIDAGIDFIYLSATQSVLAVLLLVYSLLLGQENFISRSQAMHRNGIELSRFTRIIDKIVSEVEYNNYVKDYYTILEKYENHKPIDYLYAKLSYSPAGAKEWAIFCAKWIRVKFISAIIFSHYLIAISLVFFVFYLLFSGIVSHAK